jgi:uncharacterized protein
MNVARSRAFYEALGWQGQEADATVFFQAGGVAIVLWGRENLTADARIEDSGIDRFGGIALAHNVRTADEVDEIMTTAAGAGATVTAPARSTFYGGYAGYFADPDGHAWEVAHNPGFTLDDNGNPYCRTSVQDDSQPAFEDAPTRAARVWLSATQPARRGGRMRTCRRCRVGTGC